MKSNVVLSFKRQTQAEQAAFTNDVINKMTKDAQFVSLTPQVEELKKRYDAFQIAASNAVNGGKLTTMEKDDKLADMLFQLTLVARLVDVLANENEAVILAAGFDVRKKATPVTELSTPTDVKATNVERSGAVKLTWKAVEGATIYGIERREKGTDVWRNGDYCASRSKIIEGLTINAQSEFMIRAISGTGIKSDWSQVVEVLVS
jgi:hypothetical protein